MKIIVDFKAESITHLPVIQIVTMPKQKSKKQVGLLLSEGSPLTPEQKDKLKRELHSGAVTVKTKRSDPRDVRYY
jgi:hypothetical protein